ncbi:uncharacterized protein VP01_3258g2 [Puccinia sorghi]|uniref:Uncharacterized protein n=1 Tax=Puccinia sorghi TaxID=27349 RepID=A0A0L6UYU1_9BASI|nr:uncharacterized protein VP01_3258g2 [Puccinia sorghi]
MTISESTPGSWQSTGRRRTDFPPSNPPGERRNLEGLVGSLTEQAANQYYRIQNLFRSAEEQDEETQEMIRDSAQAQTEERGPTSPSTQAAKRLFRAPSHSDPLKSRLQAIEETVERIVSGLKPFHSHRLAKLEGMHPPASEGIRFRAPDTPLSNYPESLGIHSEVQSLSNRLEVMEARYANKEKNKSKAKPKINKLARFMGRDDQEGSNKRPRT